MYRHLRSPRHHSPSGSGQRWSQQQATTQTKTGDAFLYTSQDRPLRIRQEPTIIAQRSLTGTSGLGGGWLGWRRDAPYLLRGNAIEAATLRWVVQIPRL